jgi:hypothetical protein
LIICDRTGGRIFRRHSPRFGQTLTLDTLKYKSTESKDGARRQTGAKASQLLMIPIKETGREHCI